MNNTTSSANGLLSNLIQAPAECSRAAVLDCETLNTTDAVCFGTRLPYQTTSFELATDSSNYTQVFEKLLLWTGLKAVPRCWDKIQPLLCSVYLPQCTDNKILLPDRKLCQNTRGPCGIVDVEYGWPDFLQCDNDDVYRDNCESSNSLKFNQSECELPLISTNNTESFYNGVDGCGLQCMNPLFNEKEHNDIHVFVAVWATIAMLCTLFALLSFVIDWKNSSKYPARIIFYINLCFFISGFGWLAQFFGDSRKEIVCRKDGTMRLGEPVGTGESASCVIIFILVYYFLMAGITWFDILSYSWYLMFKALGSNKDCLQHKAKVFHVIAWSVPFILLLACLSVSQIDGDSMSGICMIGYKNHMFRLGFLLIPVGVVLGIGGFFIVKGLLALFYVRKGHPGLLSESALSKITWAMLRIGVFAGLAFLFVFVTFAAFLYDFTNQAVWEKSFREYIKCEANVTILEKLSGLPPVECHLKNHPNIAILKLNLVALFGTGIVMSTWVWNKSSFQNWRRAWYRIIGKSDNETKRIQRKDKLIAKAFANRLKRKTKDRKFRRKGEEEEETETDGAGLEYTEHTITHQDPVGMDFDLHSVSQELSSTWVRNVPNLVGRRGGLLPIDEPPEDPLNPSHPRKPKNRERKTKSSAEPGLWAVSQYIDGKNIRSKPMPKEPKKQTPMGLNSGSVFIGSSPYNFPVGQTNKYYGNKYQPSHPSYHQHNPIYESCDCGGNYMELNSSQLPHLNPHEQDDYYMVHPGCIDEQPYTPQTNQTSLSSSRSSQTYNNLHGDDQHLNVNQQRNVDQQMNFDQQMNLDQQMNVDQQLNIDQPALKSILKNSQQHSTASSWQAQNAQAWKFYEG